MLPPLVIEQPCRETREFACESKFLIGAQQAESISRWARAHLSMDPHGGGAHGDVYQVSSIYFDTAGFDVFRRTGSYARSKYRIRCYNSGDTAFLERKTKTKSLVSKRRTLMPVRDFVRLQAQPESGWPGYWFQRRMQLRHLQPACQISYQRLARAGQSETGPCRLTLDSEVAARVCLQTNFAAAAGQTLLPAGRYILELKYRYGLPVLFRRMLSEFAPLPLRLSKYRLAIEILDLLPAGVAAPREVT